jgi:hypothetical protein
MTILYRIKPQHKKSIEALYDIVDNERRWSVTETYRWGQGFVEHEDELPYSDDTEHNVDPNLGWGCELDDLCYVEFEFDDSFTDEEKETIEQGWEDTGLNWVLEGDNNWQLEGDCITILGPFVVDKIDEDVYNESIETIELKPRPPFVATTAWPFSG